MSTPLRSPTHELHRLSERVAHWRPLAGAAVPDLSGPSRPNAPSRTEPLLHTLRQRLMSLLDRRLPLWRSIRAQQEQINTLLLQSAQQHAQIESLLREQRLLRRRLSSSEGGQHMMAWYQALQDDFRGPPAEHQGRFQQYLELFDAIPQHVRDVAPVLDVGCGQGDWLCALREHGLKACGVDSNADAVRAARARHCEVRQGDMLEDLETRADGTLAGLTSLQVVEHLPWSQVVHLFTEAFRAIAPGGILLAETPNPENLQVAGYSFWLDPTHQRPIPPPLLLHLAQFVGFEHCRILRSAPWPQWVQAQDAPPRAGDTGEPGAPPAQSTPEPLNTLLYGPQDYTLVAIRPVT